MNCPKCKEDTVVVEDFEFNHSEQSVTEFYVCENCGSTGVILSRMEFYCIEEDEDLEYGYIL